MMRFAMKIGLAFLKGDKKWILDRQTVDNKYRLELEDGSATWIVSRDELHDLWRTRQIQIDTTSLGPCANVHYFTTARDFSSYPEDQQEDMERRKDFLDRLAEVLTPLGLSLSSRAQLLTPYIKQVADELETKAVHATTLYRWHRKFTFGQCITTLFDRRQAGGRKSDPALQSIFLEVVQLEWLNFQKRRVDAVIDGVKDAVRRINLGLEEGEEPLKTPSPATIYRWVGALNVHLVGLKRLGPKATEQAFRKVLKTLIVDRILQRVEIDHSPIDCFIIDPETLLPLGRPWITLAIDAHSRAILGFYISFSEPSSKSVLMCIRQAIMPKEDLLREYGIDGRWPCHGIMRIIATDNGSDLHARAVAVAFRELGMEILFCGKGKPQHKGRIERVIRTIQEGLIHVLPGTTFGNVDDKGDYDSEKYACITMETLTRCVLHWIVKIYMKSPHRSLRGLQPLQKWDQGAEHVSIELPVDPEQLTMVVGDPGIGTLFHYGLETNCIRYNNDELQVLRRQKGKLKLPFKSYEEDVSFIDVLDPRTDEYLRVPSVDAEVAKGLTKHLWQVVRAQARKIGGDKYDNEDLIKARAELAEIIDASITAGKLATRKATAKRAGISSTNVKGVPIPPAPAAAPATAAPAQTVEPKPTLCPEVVEDDEDDDVFVPFECESELGLV